MARRPPLRVYRDPLEEIWGAAVARLGWRLERTDEVYAAWDGAGTLRIGVPASLDPDDSFAALVFHEFCHALVQGPEALHLPDFGLDNTSDRDLVRERAALVVQAVLAGRHGLRHLLFPTTVHRGFWEALPADPLALRHPAVPLARAALARAGRPPWKEILDAALRATAEVQRAVAPHASDDSAWRLPAPGDDHPGGSGGLGGGTGGVRHGGGPEGDGCDGQGEAGHGGSSSGRPGERNRDRAT